MIHARHPHSDARRSCGIDALCTKFGQFGAVVRAGLLAFALLVPSIAQATPVRAWVVGDSTAQPLEQAFSVLLTPKEEAPLRVRTIFKISSGLIRGDVFDWPKTAGALLAKDAPDVAVLCFGPNDAQGIMPRGARAPLELGSDAWRDEYARRVRAFADLFRARGAQVYVMLQPFSAEKKHAPKMRAVDAALAHAVGMDPPDPGLRLLDVPALIEAQRAARERWLTTLAETDPKKAKRERQTGALKNVDGIHLTFAGGKVVAEYLLKEIPRALNRAENK